MWCRWAVRGCLDLRKIALKNDGSLDKNKCMLNRALQFPDISGPMVAFEKSHDFGVHHADLLAVARVECVDEMLHQGSNVFGPFAQGRHVDGN